MDMLVVEMYPMWYVGILVCNGFDPGENVELATIPQCAATIGVSFALGTINIFIHRNAALTRLFPGSGSRISFAAYNVRCVCAIFVGSHIIVMRSITAIPILSVFALKSFRNLSLTYTERLNLSLSVWAINDIKAAVPKARAKPIKKS